MQVWRLTAAVAAVTRWHVLCGQAARIRKEEDTPLKVDMLEDNAVASLPGAHKGGAPEKWIGYY
uniref:Uncharacterized protein n=1 Tax=Oryza punctata TaxID=4537 RepID=A0A0E0M1U3_ORYPU